MCRLCAAPSGEQELAQRGHVLQLLALIEHPDALPADVALRIAREVLTLMRMMPAGRRCDAVAPIGSP